MGDRRPRNLAALFTAVSGDEKMVALTTLVAPFRETFDTHTNFNKSMVLHIVATSLSAKLCHLLVTKGANCALTDRTADTPMHVVA